MTPRQTPTATTCRLACHPDTPPYGINCVEVGLKHRSGTLELCYVVSGSIDSLRIPEARKPARRDGLWQHSCMELFVADADGTGYQEFNFSPSGEWAHYRFSEYRVPLDGDTHIKPPAITTQRNARDLIVTVELAIPPSTGRPAGLAAVLEHQAGQLSYWALTHPEAQPNFHLRDAFQLRLE